MKNIIKKIVFALIIVSLVLAIGIVIKTGKFAKLEGYMYSFAAEIINSATESNATSSNVQECATSSNATSSNVQECATSSNATSSNVQECATSSNATSSNIEENNEKIEDEVFLGKTQGKEKKNEVSFLESHKMYIMIIGVSVLAIVIVVIILIIDKKAIAKRKANNNEEK